VNELSARVDSKFAQQIADMKLNGARTPLKTARNFAIIQALFHES
jgi:hypothetical protein